MNNHCGWAQFASEKFTEEDDLIVDPREKGGDFRVLRLRLALGEKSAGTADRLGIIIF